MDITIELDDELVLEIERFAESQGASTTRALNQLLRAGIRRLKEEDLPIDREPFRQKTYNMGLPKRNLTKSLQLAAQLEDEETIRKMRLGQ